MNDEEYDEYAALLEEEVEAQALLAQAFMEWAGNHINEMRLLFVDAKSECREAQALVIAYGELWQTRRAVDEYSADIVVEDFASNIPDTIEEDHNA